MQTPSGSVSHSPVSQIASLSRPGTSSSVSSMHPYNHGYVKVEEDNYHTSHHNSSHHPSSHSNTPPSSGYSLPPFDTMDPALSGPGQSWQGGSVYSTSERVGSGGLGRSGNFLDWRHATEVRDSAILA
ncbi:hypothetical protein GYMLUDRAFT_35809 [Collybiopsis luxurians FD-317 M1]|nr:hypothetical protein GYMLUDRAFT_35809 [Collybiopsis luxurians FD-317 M1]